MTVLLVGCGGGGSSHGSPADGGSISDATSDGGAGDGAVGADGATLHDASTDGPGVDAPGDAPTSDAPVDGGAPALMLMAGNVGSVFSAAYQAGAWGPLQNNVPDAFPAAGGGVAGLADGRALGFFRGGTLSYLYASAWSPTGTYPDLVELASSASPVALGAPYATATGAYEVVAAHPMVLDTFDNATSKWTLDESTGLVADQPLWPAVTSAGGNPLVIVPSVADGGTASYQWVARQAGTWTTAAAVSGVSMYADDLGFYPANPDVVATERASGGPVVAVFVTGVGPTTYSLAAATFSSGAWSSPTSLGADLRVSDSAGLALASRPDGTVACAYATATGVKVGFFDGSTWGAFQVVPGVTSILQTPQALSIASGAPGATLELLYVAANGGVDHVRLTNESTWTWTSPVVVATPSNASFPFTYVSVARLE